MVNGTKVMLQKPKKRDFRSTPHIDFIEMVRKNTFGVLLMKSEYGQIKVVILLY